MHYGDRLACTSDKGDHTVTHKIADTPARAFQCSRLAHPLEFPSQNLLVIQQLPENLLCNDVDSDRVLVIHAANHSA